MTMLVTSWRDWRRAESRCSENLKSCPNTYHLLVRSDMLATCAKNCLLKYGVSAWGTLLNFRSPQFDELNVGHVLGGLSGLLTEYNAFLHRIFANSNFLWTNFNSFNNLIIRVSTWKCTRSDVDIISANLIRCGNRLLQDAWWLVTSRMCFEPSWTSKSSLFCLCFHKLGKSVPEVECCWWHCQFLLNVTLRGGLGVSSRSKKYSISTIWCHTINAISRCCCVGHDCKRLRLPEFQSKVLRFWQSYPELLHFKMLCKELWDHHELFPPLGHFQNDLSVSRKQPDELYLSPFLPESIYIPEQTDSHMNVLCDTSASSSAEKLECIPLNLDRLRYLSSVFE